MILYHCYQLDILGSSPRKFKLWNSKNKVRLGTVLVYLGLRLALYINMKGSSYFAYAILYTHSDLSDFLPSADYFLTNTCDLLTNMGAFCTHNAMFLPKICVFRTNI